MSGYFYYHIWLILLFIFSEAFFSRVSLAAQFDQQYLAWKVEQEAHDRRLSAQTTASKPPQQAVVPKAQVAQPSVAETKVAKNVLTIVSLNQANQQQLQQLKGVGERKARAIIEYRQQYGGFKTIEELKQVKGIGESIYLKNQAQLSL
jgi:competence protein ComEA